MSISPLIIMVIVMSLTTVGAARAASQPIDTTTYIIVLKPGPDSTIEIDEVVDAIQSDFSFAASRRYYYAATGFSAELTSGLADSLRSDTRVVSVEEAVDVEFTAALGPTGVLRTGAAYNGAARLDGVPDGHLAQFEVAIIDSGVDANHSDLNVVGGFDALGDDRLEEFCGPAPDPPWDDEDGHGTGAAGVVAALDDGVGVVGVAPGSRVHAIKISDCTGPGDSSVILEAVDWISWRKLEYKDGAGDGDPGIDFSTANMSFIMPSSSTVCNAVNTSVLTGILYTAAAGNNGQDAQVYSPANCSLVMTVSGFADYDGSTGSMTSSVCSESQYDGNVLGDDAWWDQGQSGFRSNFGSTVEIAAPAVCYLSTDMGGGYQVYGGTSGAAPHVGGAFVLFKWTTDYSVSASGPTVVQAMTNGGWTIPQSSPCGFNGDPDSFPEPVVWLAPSCAPLSLTSADLDCSGAINTTDALGVTRYQALLNYNQVEPCPDIGPQVRLNGVLRRWGDVDCDGDVDSVDAAKILEYVSGQTPSQEAGCPSFNTAVTALADPHSDPDDDADGVHDVEESSCGGTVIDPAVRPERIDGIFSANDDDGDTFVDETLPAGAAGFDCDGDGYIGTTESHVFSYASQTNGDQETCQDYDTRTSRTQTRRRRRVCAGRLIS